MPNSVPRIAVDAMGGDSGPGVIVSGALDAAREKGMSLILVGDESAVSEELSRNDTKGLDVEIVHASEVAEMTDKPSDVLRRKKDASIQVACRLVKDGRADGVVSAGNSGASVACGMFVIGRGEGVSRPAFAGILPTVKKPIVLLDVGANVDSKPRHLLQFGILGEVLARDVLNLSEPRVGILSIGEEEGKGNTLVKEAFDLLKASDLDFVGNVEGRDVFTGDVDVIVCDGFVGNVALKLTEGLVSNMAKVMKRELLGSWLGRIGTLLAKGRLRRFARFVDYAEYGGAPLLGLNGIVIVCHGASNARAICSAVKMAGRFIESDANTHIQKGLERHKDLGRE
ncbi:phosphate acyltransferase PlsX [Desulfocurvus sp. DL9XJH121]